MQNYLKFFLFYFYFTFQPFLVFANKFVWIPQFLEMLSTLTYFLVFQVGKRYSRSRLVDEFTAMSFSFSAISQVHKSVKIPQIPSMFFNTCLLSCWVIWQTVFMQPLVDDLTAMFVFQTRKRRIQQSLWNLSKKFVISKSSTFR